MCRNVTPTGHITDSVKIGYLQTSSWVLLAGEDPGGGCLPDCHGGQPGSFRASRAAASQPHRVSPPRTRHAAPWPCTPHAPRLLLTCHHASPISIPHRLSADGLHGAATAASYQCARAQTTHMYADVAKSLGAPVEPDSCALAALAARRALHLVAACMHVPAVHASMLEQSGLLQPPSTAQAVMVRSHTACSLYQAHHLSITWLRRTHSTAAGV